MKRQNRWAVLLIAVLMVAASVYGLGKYPAKNISGIVQWGAGGGTDSLMRPLAALAQKELGRSIVVQNKPGGTGSIAAQFVHDAAADGYTLLMGAENPTLYRALDISELTYDDFECVLIIGDETVGVVVARESKYASFAQLVRDAVARPGTVKLSTTGKGGLPWEVGAFITSLTGATFLQVPYDSDAAALTAVRGGECDFTICKVQSGIASYRAGDIKYLAMLALEAVPLMPEVPLVTAEYPDFRKFLPWGPFYGVFVKKGTDPAIVRRLADAFTKAFNDPTYQTLLRNLNVNPLGLTGDRAAEYVKGWRKNTLSALFVSGAITEKPEELGTR